MTKKKIKKTELNKLLSRLKKDLAAVEGFEASHPNLVETVNELSAFLANLGI